MNTFIDLLNNWIGRKKHYGFINEYMENLGRVFFGDEAEKHIHKFFSLKYEAKWQKIKEKKVRVYGLFDMNAIGECVPRFFDILDDKEEEDIIRIVLPCFPQIYKGCFYNEGLFNIFEKRLHIIDRNNFEFWDYIFRKHEKNIDSTHFYKYCYRRAGYHSVILGQSLVEFSDEEAAEGDKRMKEMGLTGDFVCIHARGRDLKQVAYKNKAVIDESDHRACDVNTFNKACDYIYSKGIDIVRMGKFERTVCNIDNIIDYSNLYWNELMDFYLLSKCKYILGSDSGLSLIAPFFGRPALITNFTEFTCTNEAFPSTGMEMYIPKKQWLVKEERYLNLYEMFDLSNRCMAFSSNYIKEGIVFEDNTEYEILESVKEFEAKLNGKWVETDDEKEIMKKYNEIVFEWKNSNSWTFLRRKMREKSYTFVFYKPSYVYLKNNKYLLDVDF